MLDLPWGFMAESCMKKMMMMIMGIPLVWVSNVCETG